MPVPPEEFGIERGATTIRESNYCFHKPSDVTEGKLIAQGYDERQVKALPSFNYIPNSEAVNRDTVDEHVMGNSTEMNSSSRRVEIIEHYVRMDYEKNGKPSLYRVVTGGNGGEAVILKLDGKEDIQEWDAMPFASITPVPQTHRFFGRSIADLVMDIQKIKTALLRGMLDNQYLALNPRVVVAETGASENTLDDLLVSRPGGIVRAKTTDAIEWQTVPDIAASVYPALEYMDSLREERTGVSRRAQTLDASALANQSATAANIAYSVSQSQIKMIAKIAAETGIKDLFWLLHAVIKKHGDKQQIVRLRNNWITVDPRNWKTREDLTVHVGLGTGDKVQQMAMLSNVMNAQKELLLGGMTNLVTPANLFASAKDLSRLSGKADPETYFSDPSKQPPPQPPQDPKLQIEMMKQQSLDKKAQADLAHQQWKMQADAALEQQKFEHNKQIELLKAQLAISESQHKQAIAERKAQVDEHVATKKLEFEGVRAHHDIATKNAETAIASHEASKPDPQSELLARLDAQHQQHQEQMAHLMKHITAPKRVVRDPKTGRVSHVETMQ
jgi:hypothetical protein